MRSARDCVEPRARRTAARAGCRRLAPPSAHGEIAAAAPCCGRLEVPTVGLGGGCRCRPPASRCRRRAAEVGFRRRPPEPPHAPSARATGTRRQRRNLLDVFELFEKLLGIRQLARIRRRDRDELLEIRLGLGHLLAPRCRRGRDSRGCSTASGTACRPCRAWRWRRRPCRR